MKDFNKDRSGFIGGSDIAAVMGLSRWDTPLSVWAKKTKKISDSIEITEAIEMGIDLEDFVAKKFEEKSGLKVRKDRREFSHPQYPCLKAHIDRWLVGGSGDDVECKTASAWKYREWEDGIPDEYILQKNWYTGIVAAYRKKKPSSGGYIAVLIGGQKFIWKKFEFDKALFERQVEVAVDFWMNFIVPVIPPMAIAGDKDTLVELFPASRTDSMITLRGDNPDLEASFNNFAIDRIEGKDQLKEIEKDVEEAENQIKQLIGDDEGIETGQFKATWKTQEKTNLDIAKMKEDGVYEKYAVKSENRVLRVVEKKGS